MLKRISNQSFVKNLKSRKLENLIVIDQIEKLLKKQRGYVFKMPKKGSSVVLLLSGGLDSITAWGILMKEFGLHVYPLSFDRGEKRAFREKASIDYFSKFYQKRFPNLYHKPIRLSLGLQDIKIPIENSLNMIHPKVLMDNFDGDIKFSNINISLGPFLLFPIYAKIYAEYLRTTANLDISTIFCSVIPSDGLLVPHQTLTSLRTMMLHLCSATGDYSWQFASAVFEKETGFYYDKSDLVEWADKNKIPLEKTWSCYYAEKYQCGGSDCRTCIVRRDAFKLANVLDKTVYSPVGRQSFVGYFKYKFGRLIDRFI